MRRAGALADALVDNAMSTWQWAGSDRLASVRGTSEALFVSIDGGPETRVELDYVPGTFGGTLCFFVCPECSQRRWHLYVGERLACYKCLGLAHQSDRTTRPAMLRAASLRQRLLDDRPIAGKRRKRMLHLLEAAETKAFAELVATMAAVERRSGNIQ